MSLKLRVVGIAMAAFAVIGTGAGFATTAYAATPQTTNFTFPGTAQTNKAILDITNGSPVPAVGTAVTFDLQQFVQNASVVVNGNNGVADSGTVLATDIEDNVIGLEANGNWNIVANQSGTVKQVPNTYVNGPSIPAADFSNLPVNTATASDPSYQLASSDTTLTLYVVSSSSNTFEVSPTLDGSAMSFTGFANIDPSLESSVTWGSTTVTPPVATRSYVTGGHVVTVGPSTATVAWNIPPVNSADGNCVVTETFGYGMTGPSGQPHYGYTCSGIGYLWGLAPHHTYSMLVIPAASDASYGNRVPDPNGQATGFIDVVTTS